MLTVTLAARGNPDFGQDPQRPLPGVPSERRRVASLAEAAAACQAYLQAHDLGSGQWAGGRVCEGKTPVAQVSYNGRLWTPTEPPSEILLP